MNNIRHGVLVSSVRCAEPGCWICAKAEGENSASFHESLQVITDDFDSSQALYRLTEKVFGRIV